MIIVIDGPAGSGKSSTAKAVSRRLGLHYLDSGALYRALTARWLREGRNDSFFDKLHHLDLRFDQRDSSFRVWIGPEELTDHLRSEQVTSAVSELASRPPARAKVNEAMRAYAVDHHCIADGRDLGTAVFPDAALKFYMDASVETRARRRLLELESSGTQATLSGLMQAISDRDRKDSTRAADPLKMADDAILIHTDALSFEAQVDKICSIIQSTLNGLGE